MIMKQSKLLPLWKVRNLLSTQCDHEECSWKNLHSFSLVVQFCYRKLCKFMRKLCDLLFSAVAHAWIYFQSSCQVAEDKQERVHPPTFYRHPPQKTAQLILFFFPSPYRTFWHFNVDTLEWFALCEIEILFTNMFALICFPLWKFFDVYMRMLDFFLLKWQAWTNK